MKQHYFRLSRAEQELPKVVLIEGDNALSNTSQIETHFDTAAIRPKPTAPGGPVRAGDSPSICYNIRQTPLYLENCMTGQTGYAFPGKCAFARQGEQYVAE